MYFIKCISIRKHFEMLRSIFCFVTVSSDDLDIPTMFVLLRNLADVQITTHLPYSTDFTIESDLARLGFYRKQILHSQHTISNTDFKLFWDTITGVSFDLKPIRTEINPEDNI